jgi:hypothetical protein
VFLTHFRQQAAELLLAAALLFSSSFPKFLLQQEGRKQN